VTRSTSRLSAGERVCVLRGIFCAAVGWMQSELLFLTLCTHDHCVRDCCVKIYGRKWKVDLSCTEMRTDCSTPDCILIRKVFTAVYIFRIVTTTSMLLTTK